jgi:hypothetical protein
LELKLIEKSAMLYSKKMMAQQENEGRKYLVKKFSWSAFIISLATSSNLAKPLI